MVAVRALATMGLATCDRLTCAHGVDATIVVAFGAQTLELIDFIHTLRLRSSARDARALIHICIHMMVVVRELICAYT